MPKFIEGFKSFILRGNVVDLAIGVIIGASFNSVVQALVKDILMPLISAIVKIPDLSTLTFTLNGSAFLYGDFLNVTISFVLNALAVYFFVILPMNAFIARTRAKKHPTPTTKVCPECLSTIPIEAKRCAQCAQVLPKPAT